MMSKENQYWELFHELRRENGAKLREHMAKMQAEKDAHKYRGELVNDFVEIVRYGSTASSVISQISNSMELYYMDKQHLLTDHQITIKKVK
jgi:hypothetical protein